jgi:hypothetical protein
MSITETLRKTIDDLRADERVETLVQDLDRITTQALETVGGYVSAREEHINGFVEKVAATLDNRPEGRFADEIGKVTGLVHGGVASLAERGSTDPA